MFLINLFSFSNQGFSTIFASFDTFFTTFFIDRIKKKKKYYVFCLEMMTLNTQYMYVFPCAVQSSLFKLVPLEIQDKF